MNIPIELFIGFISISVFLAVLGFLARSNKLGTFTVIAGLMIFPMISVTDNIIMSYAEPFADSTYNEVINELIYRMNVTTSNSSVSLQNTNFGASERPVNIASLLYNMPISCVSIDLSKTGAPSGTVTFAIMGGTGNIIKSFGTLDISTEVSSTQRTYTKCLANHDYWLISLHEKVGVFYNSGTAGNGLNVYTVTNGFDGTNTVRATLSSGGTWTDSTTTDVRMILTYDNSRILNTSDLIDNPENLYPFTDWVKVLFGLYASILMLCGVLIMRSES